MLKSADKVKETVEGGEVFGFRRSQLHSPASRVLFKFFRLPHLIKYYINKKIFYGVNSKRKHSYVRLVDSSSQYKILNENNSRTICITWPEKFSEPVSNLSELGGYWPVDVRRVGARVESYFLYWLYPFDYNLHVWTLNANGERTGFHNVNDFSKYKFFLDRLNLSKNFRVRLYMLCFAWGDERTCAEIRADLFADARGGSSEAIYCILSAPKLFSNDELRICVDQAIINIYNLSSSVVPREERQLQLTTLERLAEALEAHEPMFECISMREIHQKIDYCKIFRDIRHVGLRDRINKTRIHFHKMGSDNRHLGSQFHDQSIAIIGDAAFSEIDFHFLNSKGESRERVMNGAAYANYLISICEQEKEIEFCGSIIDEKWILDFEAGDFSGRGQSVAFGREVGALGVGLIPDLYYFSSRGFQSGWINGAVPPWESKASMFTWRGITTGGHGHTVDSIATLPRVRLCEIGGALGPLADLGITQIVQGRSEEDAKQIEARLKSLGLWRDHMPQYRMGASKYLLEIDGNSNSWGFFAKLLMGCCVLKVGSPYEQWFYQDLKPWVHYIPITRDLSNLVETMEWCLLNEPACRDIAGAGMAFAQARTFDREMKAAAATMASMARPLI